MVIRYMLDTDICIVLIKNRPESIRRHLSNFHLLKKSGTPIGAMDLLIASHALFLDTVLVTNNLREYERIPDLKIENWLG